MKKAIYFLLMLMAVVSFSACSSDDDDNDGGQMDKYRQILIGRWKLKSEVTFVNQYSWNEENPVTGNLYLTLNSNGSCSFTGSASYDTYTEIFGEKTKIATKNISFEDYNVKTWSVGTTGADYDAAIFLTYYIEYQKMDWNLTFSVDFTSNTRIELHQNEAKDYYVFEKVN